MRPEMKILITYASAQGATKGIAEHIHARLLTQNLGQVDIKPATPPPSFDGVDAVIIGSCIHIGSWLKPGSNLVKGGLATFAKEHPERPIWAFSVGMPPKDGAKETEEANMDKWLRGNIPIRGHTLFMGRYQLEGMPWLMKTVLRLVGVKDEDRRDWEAIDQWTDKIITDIKPKEPEGE